MLLSGCSFFCGKYRVCGVLNVFSFFESGGRGLFKREEEEEEGGPLTPYNFNMGNIEKGEAVSRKKSKG